MSMRLRANRLGAFTVTDVLIMVATVAVLGGLAYSGFSPWHRQHVSASRIACANHLRQLGLACRVWADDNRDRFPMSVSTNEGGALEFVDSGGVFRIFQVMSNEVSAPKILVCPTDTNRQPATNFFSLTDANSSYFVNLDADETRPQTILLGDRNISTNGQLMSGILKWPAAGPVTWTADLHKHVGNLALADGSSQQSTDSTFSNASSKSASSGTKPMRFSIP